MKRLIASIAILLVITTYLLSCEKDDICADGTPTTPGLVVEFYKKGSDGLNKVTNFKYWVPAIEGDTLPTDTVSEVSRIILPLPTDKDEVTWALQYNTTVAGLKSSNTDLFTVKYARKDTYISRACGYKTTFTLVPETSEDLNPSITPGDDGPFIVSKTIVTPNIENENEVHVKIYF